MPHFYEFSATLTKFGFCATFIVNLFFINLTVAHTKVITGTYRKMLVIFALACITFSGMEIVAQPCVHNFNGGFIYFSLNDSPMFSQYFLRIICMVYSACFVAQLAFIAIQFIFRYLTLIQHSFRKSFQNRKQIFWILYFFAIGILYGFLVLTCLKTDDYSDNYIEEELKKVYVKEIRDTPRFLAVAYEKNGTIRWRPVMFLAAGSATIGFQYAIIIFCAFQMQKHMKTSLANLSSRNKKLEMQFLKALVVQILLPTVLLTLPIGSVLALPLFDLKISLQTSLIYALYSLYPPLDSIATMVIIKEYRSIVRDLIRGVVVFKFKEEGTRTTITTSEAKL